MGKYFDDNHASPESQLGSEISSISDSPEVAALREKEETAENLLALGDALCKQLRYKEAIAIFTRLLEDNPDDIEILRRRAARYLSTLQAQRARADFLRCLEMGGDEIDITYRAGLCSFILREYSEAMKWFGRCHALCDEEMGIAAIYWHTLAAYRISAKPELLSEYHSQMKVGHHTAYEKAVSVFAGAEPESIDLTALDDVDYSIAAYGLSGFMAKNGDSDSAEKLIKSLLARDSFWISYAYLAAWNDKAQ